MMSTVRFETEPPSYLTSLVQGPFTSSGFKTFCQRCRHCTSVLSSKYSAAETADIVDARGKTGTISRGLLLQGLQLEILHISRLIERAAYRLASSFCHHDDAQLSAAARPASQTGGHMNVYIRCPRVVARGTSADEAKSSKLTCSGVQPPFADLRVGPPRLLCVEGGTAGRRKPPCFLQNKQE